jgi:hypothetical protein
MATFTERCKKCRRGTVHSGHTTRKVTRRRLFGGTVTDVYKCPGVKRAGR